MTHPSHALPNRTRTSASIPRRLLREGKLHLLPVYALMRTSDLAREGIDNSGSFRFADHVYRREPSGRYGIGVLLDAVLLRMRSARSMRNRFLHAQREIIAAAERRAADLTTPFHVLSVPCGVARELARASVTLRATLPVVHAHTRYFGLDVDPEPLALSRRLEGVDERFDFVRGDVFDADVWPRDLDVICSTGLGEFLTDAMLGRFYRHAFAVLREGGVFVTSGMFPDPIADYLMRELGELRATYRGADELVPLLVAAGFGDITARLDDVGLQTLIVARKPGGDAR
ncbi:MAG TPA: class I SAM-dependent methyltransferase family protein [Gemmatimonadaceae bacterium]|nr:class I SAM-dependent methyltransferase family protein [Gemmatimonadaceae bacterium]